MFVKINFDTFEYKIPSSYSFLSLSKNTLQISNLPTANPSILSQYYYSQNPFHYNFLVIKVESPFSPHQAITDHFGKHPIATKRASEILIRSAPSRFRKAI